MVNWTIPSETIVAPATARGAAAVAILRLSGAQSRSVLETISGALPPPRRLTVRDLRDSSGELLDCAAILWLPGPASYTGEDSAELHVHGGAAVVRRVLSAVLSHPGIRPAEPGEFTRRAVLNGKMNLAEAEGIADLVAAETDMQRRVALAQQGGALSRACESWQSALLDALAWAESALDFSDEGDVPEDVTGRIFPIVTDVANALREALHIAPIGERLRVGFRVVILGAPNAGKSTLLNRLVQREAAIVTDRPGTTRDVIEVSCDLGGWPVSFLDTAGLRDSEDPIERIGMAKALAEAASADLVLWLLAPGDPPPAPQGWSCPVLTVGSKGDLEALYSVSVDLTISARDGAGIDGLGAAIAKSLGWSAGVSPLITRERQRVAIQEALQALEQALRIPGDAPELLAETVRMAVRALGRVTGTVDVERVLDRIFSTFCIGK